MLVQKGNHLRQVEKYDIYDASENCIYDMLDIVSSPKTRAIVSAYSFIKGLCPNNYD